VQKFLILGGAIFLLVALLWPVAGKIGFGKLPGDLAFNVGQSRIYVPVVTCIIISVIITLVARLFGR
jgi:ABC-type methionine transport system permease subunit